MKSIGFPKMLNTTSTVILKDHEATLQNLKNLLLSEQKEFVSDPYYGVKLRRYIFDQNNKILKGVLIDEIYTQIALFMPQLTCTRNDINIVQDDFGNLTCSIQATNKLDYETDLYNIVLFQNNV